MYNICQLNNKNTSNLKITLIIANLNMSICPTVVIDIFFIIFIKYLYFFIDFSSRKIRVCMFVQKSKAFLNIITYFVLQGLIITNQYKQTIIRTILTGGFFFQRVDNSSHIYHLFCAKRRLKNDILLTTTSHLSQYPHLLSPSPLFPLPIPRA